MLIASLSTSNPTQPKAASPLFEACLAPQAPPPLSSSSPPPRDPYQAFLWLWVYMTKQTRPRSSQPQSNAAEMLCLFLPWESCPLPPTTTKQASHPEPSQSTYSFSPARLPHQDIPRLSGPDKPYSSVHKLKAPGSNSSVRCDSSSASDQVHYIHASWW